MADIVAVFLSVIGVLGGMIGLSLFFNKNVTRKDTKFNKDLIALEKSIDQRKRNILIKKARKKQITKELSDATKEDIVNKFHDAFPNDPPKGS